MTFGSGDPLDYRRINEAKGEIGSDEDVTLTRVTITDNDTATSAYDLFDIHIFVPSARFIKMTTASHFILYKSTNICLLGIFINVMGHKYDLASIFGDDDDDGQGDT